MKKQETNYDRIIGDFLELHAEINSMSTSDDYKRYPKFIKNIIIKKYHKKLVNTVSRLRSANQPLTRDNLIEYFTYLFNNYPPHGTYKSTTVVKKLDGIIFAVVKIDNMKIKFNIGLDENNFNIVIHASKEDDNIKSYDVSLRKLYTENKKVSDMIDRINQVLISDMTDYILENIETCVYSGKKEV